MLIALTTALLLFLSGGGIDASGVRWTIEQLQSIVADQVADESRLARVEEVLHEMSAELETFQGQAFELRRRLVDMAAAHEATPEDFRAVVREIEANWERTEQRLLDLRFRLRDLTTRAEWNAIFGELRSLREKG